MISGFRVLTFTETPSWMFDWFLNTPRKPLGFLLPFSHLLNRKFIFEFKKETFKTTKSVSYLLLPVKINSYSEVLHVLLRYCFCCPGSGKTSRAQGGFNLKLNLNSRKYKRAWQRLLFNKCRLQKAVLSNSCSKMFCSPKFPFKNSLFL